MRPPTAMPVQERPSTPGSTSGGAERRYICPVRGQAPDRTRDEQEAKLALVVETAADVWG